MLGVGAPTNLLGVILVPNRRGAGPDTVPDRYAGLKSRSPRDALSFSAVGGNIVPDAIDAITGAGDLVSFSRTRDGGACVVCIVSDGVVVKAYATDCEELREALVAATEGALALP